MLFVRTITITATTKKNRELGGEEMI